MCTRYETYEAQTASWVRTSSSTIVHSPINSAHSIAHDRPSRGTHHFDYQACLSLTRLLQEPVPSSSSGPSKNAAKKAEKAAKKAAAKGGKGAPQSEASAAAAPAATNAKITSAPSLPSMYLSGDGPGPLKCLTAAKFFGVEVEAADVNPAGEGTKHWYPEGYLRSGRRHTFGWDII